MRKTTWIALLRGINVGGKNRVPMERLKSVLESLGCESIRTIIQSGNVVFEHRRRSKDSIVVAIEDALESELGFPVATFVLAVDELLSSINENPFGDVSADPKTTHLYFLAAEPTIQSLDSIAQLAANSERFLLKGKVFYLHAPDGIGRSKLARSAESRLGVSATARNLKTLLKLKSMVSGSP